MRTAEKSGNRDFKKTATMRSLRAFQWLLRHLPRWMTAGIIRCLFPLAAFGMKGLKKICLRNFRAVCGDSKSNEEYSSMFKKLLRQTGRTMVDMLYYVERPKEFSRICRLDGEEHLKKALAGNRGVIAFTAHLNNFPLMFEALVQKGYTVNAVIRPMRNPQFGKFMSDLCAKWGIRMIRTAPRKEFIRKTYGALERNELLFILLDEVVREGTGVSVPFLNGTVRRATGPLLFHKKFGSPILPMFIVQDKEHNFHIRIEPPVELEKGADRTDYETKNIAKMNAVIERYVLQYPYQWGGWFNKRWNE